MSQNNRLRIRVSLQNHHILFPITHLAKQKVEVLTTEIAKAFHRLVHPIHSDQLIIQEVTLGGCTLNPNDVIEEALRDDDHLQVIDYDTWFNTNLALNEKYWFNMEAQDFILEKRFWLTISLHKHGILMIQAGINRDTKKLELLDRDALTNSPKDGKHLLFHWKQPADAKWYIEVNTITEKGVVRAIEASIKPSQCKIPLVKKFTILHEDKKIQKGEETLISDAEEGEEESAEPSPPLPAPTKEGPGFEPDTVEPNPKHPLAKSESNPIWACPLAIEQTHPVWQEQTNVGYRTGTYWNNFFATFQIVNKTDSAVAIQAITVQYKDKKGEWQKFDETFVGWRQRNGDFNCNSEPAFQIPEKEVLNNFAIRSGKEIHDKQYEKRCRAHRQFPQPMEIQYTFEDSDGKKATIICIQQNNNITVSGPKSITKDDCDGDASRFLFVSYADDTDYDARVGVAGFLDDKKANLSLKALGGSYSSYNRDTIKKLAYTAVKENNAEVYLEGSSKVDSKEPNFYAKTYLLVDLKATKVYGIKVDSKTTTSHTVEYFPFPALAKSS